MRLAITLLAALLPALAAAQATEGRTYTPGPFDGIEISGAAAVRFAQGSTDFVHVEGDADAQRAVEVEVRNGQLQIRPAGSWKFWNSQRLQVQVTARDLKRVVISGAADLVAPAPVQLSRLAVVISGAGLARFDKLQADELSFTVSGAGDGQMAGRVRQLGVNVSGKSEFRGEELASERASVRVSGVGDVKVWATQQLMISVSGIGSVDYWGTPQVTRHSSGIARIHERGPKTAP